MNKKLRISQKLRKDLESKGGVVEPTTVGVSTLSPYTIYQYIYIYIDIDIDVSETKNSRQDTNGSSKKEIENSSRTPPDPRIENRPS